MATKKVTTVTEEEIVPEVSSTEDHDKAVLEALAGDDALTLEPDKLDEPAEEPKEEEVEPVLDKEAIKAELKAEVTEEVKKEIEALKEDQTIEQKDEYDKFVEEYTAKNGQAPEWKQVATFLKEQAKSELKAELDAEVKQEEQQAQETQQAEEQKQQELNDTLDKTWNKQLDDMVAKGLIPKIANPDDNRVQEIKNDEGKIIESIPLEPGKKARYELFKAMYLASNEEIERGGEPITNLKEVYYEHYSNSKQPAGANAPIAGARRSVSSDSGNSFKYSDIHNTSIEDLITQG